MKKKIILCDSSQTPKPKAAVSLKAVRKLPRSSDLFQFRKELYRELAVSSAWDPLVGRLDWSLEENRSQWNWVPGSGFLNIPH